MAVTGAVTLSPSACNAGVAVQATLTITNGNAGAVNVTSINPYTTINGSNARTTASIDGLPILQPGVNSSVAGSSGTKPYIWTHYSFGPQTDGVLTGSPATLTYVVGAIATIDDGTIIDAHTTIVVTAPI